MTANTEIAGGYMALLLRYGHTVASLILVDNNDAHLAHVVLKTRFTRTTNYSATTPIWLNFSIRSATNVSAGLLHNIAKSETISFLTVSAIAA